MDRTEISLRADILLPWADIPQSALGSAMTQHPPKCGTHSIHRKGYPLEALAIMNEDA
jgi:hypothetical protein